MIIKRFTNGAFVELHPKTKTTRLFDSTGDVQVFDSFDKIKPNFLPNSVFDSLYFRNAITVTSNLRNLGLDAVNDANVNGRSPIGYYFVASNQVTVTGANTGGDISIQFTNPGPTTVTLHATTSTFNPGEEGSAVVESRVLETGDWFILTDVTGAGTSANPHAFEFAVVNNTYELATISVPGIVKLGFVEDVDTAEDKEYKVQTTTAGLYVKVPWENTTVIANGSIGTNQLADLAVDTGKLAANAVTTGKIGANQVTNGALRRSVAFSVIGNSSIIDETDVSDIVASDNGQVLRRTSSGLSFGTIATEGIANNAVTADKIGANAVTGVKIINDAVDNTKLANMTAFKIKGNNTDAAADPKDLTALELRIMSNLQSVLFGQTLPNPGTNTNLQNTPINKSNGMADGSGIPAGTI